MYLEVQVWWRAFGVAAVTDVANDVTGADAFAVTGISCVAV
jgi:hypothetical protein